jgi:hypothetical protein
MSGEALHKECFMPKGISRKGAEKLCTKSTQSKYFDVR